MTTDPDKPESGFAVGDEIQFVGQAGHPETGRSVFKGIVCHVGPVRLRVEVAECNGQPYYAPRRFVRWEDVVLPEDQRQPVGAPDGK